MQTSELGKIIRYHRSRAGLSRADCARLAGIGKTALFDLEHGKATVKLSTVLAVCDALGISVETSSPLMEEYRATSAG